MKYVLLAGMMRSGTTFLQKVLDAHPEISFKYQEETSFFLDQKKRFLESINDTSYHVLSHYDEPNHYDLNQFLAWLGREELFFDELKSRLSCDDAALSVCGMKEVLIEEFLPGCVHHNIKCLVIIRDPRDVIASMSFGKGKMHTGVERPVLFDVRNWRKSVAITRLLKGEPDFKSIRFEDLILKKEKVMQALFEWIGVKNRTIQDLTDAMTITSKKKWEGNSSFGKRALFDPNAIGNYKANIPPEVERYIQALAQDEMLEMGYKVSVMSNNERENIIANYSDPFMVKRKEFASNYSSQEINIEYEIDRLNGFNHV